MVGGVRGDRVRGEVRNRRRLGGGHPPHLLDGGGARRGAHRTLFRARPAHVPLPLYDRATAPPRHAPRGAAGVVDLSGIPPPFREEPEEFVPRPFLRRGGTGVSHQGAGRGRLPPRGPRPLARLLEATPGVREGPLSPGTGALPRDRPPLDPPRAAGEPRLPVVFLHPRAVPPVCDEDPPPLRAVLVFRPRPGGRVLPLPRLPAPGRGLGPRVARDVPPPGRPRLPVVLVPVHLPLLLLLRVQARDLYRSGLPPSRDPLRKGARAVDGTGGRGGPVPLPPGPLGDPFGRHPRVALLLPLPSGARRLGVGLRPTRRLPPPVGRHAAFRAPSGRGTGRPPFVPPPGALPDRAQPSRGPLP